MRALLGLIGALAAATTALSIVYLTTACEDLPAFLGPSPGDTHPRTALGVVAAVLAVAFAVAALTAARGSSDV
jgi:hypothetical protein